MKENITFIIEVKTPKSFHLELFFCSKFDLIKSDYHSIEELACLVFDERLYYVADVAWERQYREDPKDGENDM